MLKQNLSNKAKAICERYKSVPVCRNPDGPVANNLTSTFVAIVLHHMEPEDIGIIADIGSRDAAQTVELAHVLNHAKVYCFEPAPVNIPYCLQNISKSGLTNIEFYRYALTDYDGLASFFEVPRGNFGASSLLKVDKTHPRSREWHQEEIKVRANKYTSLGFHTPDLIWMDVQGNEIETLKGFGETLKKVKAIHTEVQHSNQYESQYTIDELDSVLQDFEMVHEEFTGSNAITRYESDRIYINKELLK